MKKKLGNLLGITAVFGLVAAFGLSACSSAGASSSSAAVEGLTGGVAATVNGKEIMEDEITTYIQTWRETNNMTDEDSWGNYLVSIGENPAQLREYIIDGHISEILTEQAAGEMGIEVTDAEIDEAVASMRANYPSDEAWQTALEQAGTNEEDYRESIRKSLLDQRVQEKVSEEAAPVTDEQLLENAQMYADMVDGMRRSSHILFSLEDKETAEKVLAQLQDGSLNFEDAAKEYSVDSSGANGGDVGWDKINSFVAEYQEGLDALQVGEISGLVESQYGYHIIKCTDLYTLPEGGITSVDQIPEALLDMIKSQLESSAKTTAVGDWYAKYKEEADIVINEMPEGLPYNIDITPYQEAASSAAAEGEDGMVVEVEDEAGASADAEATAEGETATEDAAAEGATAAGEATDTTTEQPAEISSSSA